MRMLSLGLLPTWDKGYFTYEQLRTPTNTYFYRARRLPRGFAGSMSRWEMVFEPRKIIGRLNDVQNPRVGNISDRGSTGWGSGKCHSDFHTHPSTLPRAIKPRPEIFSTQGFCTSFGRPMVVLRSKKHLPSTHTVRKTSRKPPRAIKICVRRCS